MSDDLPGWLSEPPSAVDQQLAIQAAVDARLRRQLAAARDPFGEVVRVREYFAHAGFRVAYPGWKTRRRVDGQNLFR